MFKTGAAKLILSRKAIVRRVCAWLNCDIDVADILRASPYATLAVRCTSLCSEEEKSERIPGSSTASTQILETRAVVRLSSVHTGAVSWLNFVTERAERGEDSRKEIVCY